MFHFEKEPVFIEIDDDSIKLVLVKTLKGRREIVSLIKKEFSSKDDSLIAEEIKKFLEPFGIPGRKIFINIPRHLITARLLKLPSTSEEEISKIVRIESLKRIPHANEDVIIAHSIVEKFDDGYSRVLLVIAQAAVVNKPMDMLKTAGIKDIEFIALGSESLFLWYQVAAKNMAKGSVAVINIDTYHMDIDIIEGDSLIFTRGVSYDPSLPAADEKIINEIKISMTTYQKESNKTIEEVIITGSPGGIKGYKEFLARELDVPIKVMDQMSDIPLKQGAQMEASGASFIELLGLSLKYKDARINLLPEDKVKENRVKASKRTLAFTLILSVLIVLAAFGLALKKLHDKTLYFSQINLEINRINPQAAKAKKMLKDISVIKEEMNKKPRAIDVIGELHKTSSEGISLSMIDFEREKSVTVRGSASALDEVLKYSKALKGSSYFEKVDVKYASKRGASGKEIVDFEIDCILVKGK